MLQFTLEMNLFDKFHARQMAPIKIYIISGLINKLGYTIHNFFYIY